MNRQNATKEIIAYSFKYLAREKDIDKISITDIMDQTDFRRQTF
ncbi:dihydroxyacetone kinase transcriptional activator DhaS, partial [Listeria monocytogenes]|nr:dihydroxyacetone kinase transcriptional activator DhaS [Listeria monocytogenes]